MDFGKVLQVFGLGYERICGGDKDIVQNPFKYSKL
jgi:hypothetical protein